MTDGSRSVLLSPSGLVFRPDKAAPDVEPEPEGEPEGGFDLGPRGPADAPGDVPLGFGGRPVIPGPVPPHLGPELQFAADHPTDPNLQIHYTVLEGPEVGVYARGTANLIRGRATVTLPDHFAHVASEESLTAHLTPRSADSRGVATLSLTSTELQIVELGQGTGEYSTGEYKVDWVVNGIRKGRERYRVVRPKRPIMERRPPPPTGAERDGR